MDDFRFDMLARLLAGGSNRRGFLAWLAGLAAGLARAVPAQSTRPPEQIKGRGGQRVCKLTGAPGRADRPQSESQGAALYG